MKQQILSAVLTLCLCTSSLPAVHTGQEAPSPQEDVFTKESVSELSTRDSTVPSPQEIYEAMIALKGLDAYKEETTWTNDTPYPDSAGAYYQWKGGTLGGANIVAVGCVAFAFILSDKAFGSLPARIYATGGFSFEDIKVGDILQVNNDAHTVIVLSVDDAGVIVAEGNYNGKVHWGRAIPKDEVMNSTSHYITRYPENYAPPDDPTANDIVDSGTLGSGLAWKLTKAGTITISGSGAMPDFSSTGDQPWNSYSSQIRKVVIENGVTGIGSCAFWNCEILSAEISSSVASIGNSAFRGSSLLSVTIPSSVKTIGDSAFCECPSLISVTVSEGVETISQNAFRSCTSLASIALPASIEEVGAAAFFQCQAMKSATFAAGSKQVKLGDNIFTRCYELANITMPRSIDRIGEGMFQNCLILTEIEIPQGAQSIGGSAFASCSRLTTVTIPDSVTTIGTAAFAACPLTDIYFTGTETQWNSINKMGDTISAVLKATIHYNCSSDPTPPPDPTPTPDPVPVPPPDVMSEPDSVPVPGAEAAPDSTPVPAPVPAPAPGARFPFIKGESGKEGWEAIKEDAVNAFEGQWITVNMNGISTVPGNVIDCIKEKNATLAFDMGNGLIWFVNGKNVTAEHANDVDFSVQVGTSAIPQHIVEGVAGSCQATQLSLAYSGYFGYSAVLMINLGAANAGLYANLYYYNESADGLEFVTVDQIDENGIAELIFSHASDYVIVIGNDVTGESPGETSSGNNGVTANSSNSKETGVHTPKAGEFDILIGGFNLAEVRHKGNGLNLIWLFLIGASVMSAAGIITFLIYKKIHKN